MIIFDTINCIYKRGLLNMKNYTLSDVVDIHNQYPETFEIPTTDEVNNIKIGDYCKLIFKVDQLSYRADAERMWVKVTSIDGNQYVGTLANDPVVVDLVFGGVIAFGMRNIASIMDGE